MVSADKKKKFGKLAILLWNILVWNVQHAEPPKFVIVLT